MKNRFIKAFSAIWACLFIAGGFTALGAQAAANGWAIPATAITVTAEGTTVAPGKTLQINAKITPENATDKRVAWSVSNPSIATISDSGLLSGLKVGRVKVTAATRDGSNLKGSLSIDVCITSAIPPSPSATPTPPLPPWPPTMPAPPIFPMPPFPDELPEATGAPEDTAAPGPSAAPSPTVTPHPGATSGPAVTPSPTVTPNPNATPGNTESPAPSTSPVPPLPSDTTAPPTGDSETAVLWSAVLAIGSACAGLLLFKMKHAGK